MSIYWRNLANFFNFAVHLWQILCQFGGWLGWIYGVFGKRAAAAIFANLQIQYILTTIPKGAFAQTQRKEEKHRTHHRTNEQNRQLECGFEMDRKG
jgi:hypothetical protein